MRTTMKSMIAIVGAILTIGRPMANPEVEKALGFN
jgi:hypothetical protein